MGDLISRLVYKSDLLKMVGVLNKQHRKAILDGDNDLILAIQNKLSAYTTALRLLDYEPTAYDSRKVIEELEKAIEIIKQNGNEWQDAITANTNAINDAFAEWQQKTDVITDLVGDSLNETKEKVEPKNTTLETLYGEDNEHNSTK